MFDNHKELRNVLETFTMTLSTKMKEIVHYTYQIETRTADSRGQKQNNISLNLFSTLICISFDDVTNVTRSNQGHFYQV